MKRLVLDVSCYAYLIIVVLQKYLIIVACDHGVAVYVKHLSRVWHVAYVQFV